MKRTALLIIVLFLAVPTLNADTGIGIIGGPTAVSFVADNDENDIFSMASYGYGIVIDMGLAPYIGIRLEPMILRKGAESDVYLDDIYEFTGKYKIDYLELPVLLKAGFGIPYLFAGPSMGFVLKSNLVTDVELGEIKVDTKSVTKSTDFSLAVGAGLNFSFSMLSLFIEGRYLLGLSDILDDGVLLIADEPLELAGTVKNRGIHVMAGLMVSF